MSNVRQLDPAGICTNLLAYLVDKGGYLPKHIVVAPRHWDKLRAALRPLGLTDQNTWLQIPLVQAESRHTQRYYFEGSDFDERVPFLPDQKSVIERVLYDIMHDIMSTGGFSAIRYVIPPGLFQELTEQLGINTPDIHAIKFFGHILSGRDNSRHTSVCHLNP